MIARRRKKRSRKRTSRQSSVKLGRLRQRKKHEGSGLLTKRGRTEGESGPRKENRAGPNETEPATGSAIVDPITEKKEDVIVETIVGLNVSMTEGLNVETSKNPSRIRNDNLKIRKLWSCQNLKALRTNNLNV